MVCFSKVLLSVSLLVASATCLLTAQAPSIEWQVNLGGTSSDELWALEKTSDGGYIMAGRTKSNDGDVPTNRGHFDYWIVKLDGSGRLEWQKTLGGSDADAPESIQQTFDGGYIIAGGTRSNDGDVTGNKGHFDYWIVKLDESGNLGWQKTFGGSNDEYAYSIKQSLDSGYVVVGTAESNDGDVTVNKGGTDCWVVKLDGAGNKEWQKTLGGSDIDLGFSVDISEDGGYMVAVTTISNDGDVTDNKGLHDYWLVKLDSLGNLQWQNTFGGSSVDWVNSMQQTSDKGYILAGTTLSDDGDVTGNNGNGDIWITKVDSSGNLKWQNTLGGSMDEVAFSVQQLYEGGYIIAAQTNSLDGDVTGNHGDYDYWIVKLDESGSLEWEKTLGGSEFDRACSVKPSDDGGYVVAGMSRSNDGNVIGHKGELDFWVVKLSNVSSVNQDSIDGELKIYPNPVGDQLALQLPRDFRASQYSITTIDGRVIDNGFLRGNSIATDRLSPGTYVLQIYGDERTYQAKFLKM